MATQFPITLWPGIQAEAGAVLGAPVEVDAAGFLHWAGPLTPIGPLPSEVVIRELLTYSPTETATLTFLNTFGAVTERHEKIVLEPSDVSGDDDSALVGATSVDVRREFDEHTRRSAGGATNHWMDAAAFLRDAQMVARSCIDHWNFEYIGDIWQSTPGDGIAELPRKLQTSARRLTEENAWGEVARTLNSGLRSFPMRAEATISGTVRVGAAPVVELFPALCLQVANLIVQGIPPQRCANETCGGWFVHQRDGAKHGQFRSMGVKYCTTACAQQQVQREYRRRKSEARQAARTIQDQRAPLKPSKRRKP